MDLRASLRSALQWLRTLGVNLYFWGGMAALLMVGLIAYLVVDAILMPTYTRHDISTQVPNVERRPFAEADSLLRRHELQVKRRVGRYNPNVKQGLVVDQAPLPNSDVKPGRRVYLTVNAGAAPTVRIPDLTGMSVREARNRVASVGLEVDTVRADPVPSPYANTITKQTPRPGDSLKKGGEVALWYSTGLGEKEVKVPNVVGYVVDVARDTLLHRNLRAVVVDASFATPPRETSAEEDTTGGPRYVQRQGNSPGSSVRSGTEVRLFTVESREKALERRTALQDTSAPTD